MCRVFHVWRVAVLPHQNRSVPESHHGPDLLRVLSSPGGGECCPVLYSEVSPDTRVACLLTKVWTRFRAVTLEAAVSWV